ncbi:type II toxin-antitoxin system mRNA interferase toxin, RelE/StbE family [Candidatus Collierbacteria bacterium]|nr:type II toxin-antitoxin system mRNA interferase toxin, RelE/StbE family [Candidatus Collierbacteria bacterium]
MKAKFSRTFGKQYAKAPSKIKSAFNKRLEQFLRNQFHPLLNNHALIGKYFGCRSINISGDWRAIFREISSGIAYFEVLGTHSQLYRK